VIKLFSTCPANLAGFHQPGCLGPQQQFDSNYKLLASCLARSWSIARATSQEIALLERNSSHS
jgi:hypothetical protein